MKITDIQVFELTIPFSRGVNKKSPPNFLKADALDFCLVNRGFIHYFYMLFDVKRYVFVYVMEWVVLICIRDVMLCDLVLYILVWIYCFSYVYRCYCFF